MSAIASERSFLERVDRDRRSARWRALTCGLAYCALIFCGATLFGATFDRLGWVPPPLRMAGLVGSLVAVAIVGHRCVLQPWRRYRTLPDWAARLELEDAGWSGSLVSAVHFDARESLGAFEAATVLSAERAWLDGERQPALPGLGWSRWLAIACVALLAWRVAAPSEWERAAFARWFDPYGAHAWPSRTRIEFGGPATVNRGDAWIGSIRITGYQPDQFFIEWRCEGQTAQALGCPVPAGSAGAVLPVQLEAYRITGDFWVRAVANDGASEWGKVNYLVPTELAPLHGRPSPAITAVPPAYTGSDAVAVPSGTQLLEIVTGTRLKIAAAWNKPIQRAWIEPAPELQSTGHCIALASLGDVRGYGSVASAAVARAARQSPDFALAAGEASGALEWMPSLRGPHFLTWIDWEGIVARYPLDIRLNLDPSPEVALDSPAAGSAEELLPTAKLPLFASANDPRFGIRDLNLTLRINDEPPFRIALPGPASMAELRAALAGNLRLPYGREANWKCERTLDLARLAKRDGRPLAAGDALVGWFEASDFDDVTWNKPPGRSGEFALRIVAGERIEANAQQLLEKVHRELQLADGLQKQLADQLAKLDAADPAARAAAQHEAERIERQILQRIDPQAPHSAAAELKKLTGMLERNPLPDSPLPQRAAELEPALDAVRERQAEPLLESLGELPKLNNSAEAQQEARRAQQLAGQQRQALDDLRDRLAASTRQQQLRTAAQQLARDQAQLQQQTEKLADGGESPRDAEALADAQRSLGQKVQAWQRELEQAERSAQRAIDQSAGDPLRQARAEQALEQLRGVREQLQPPGSPSLNERLENAAEALKRNQLGKAEAEQAAVAQALQRAQEKLTPPGAEPLDRLAKEAKQQAEQLDDLLEKQNRLQAQAESIRQQTPPEEQPAEFKKLASEQAELQKQAEELAMQLSRREREDTARRVQRSAEQMERAQAKLAAGQSPIAEQDEALDELETAQQKLEQTQREIEEQLQRERAEQLAQKLEALLERQRGHIAEAERIRQLAAGPEGWTRPLKASLRDLTDGERQLGAELEQLRDANFREPSVPRLALQRAIDAAELLPKLGEALVEQPAWEADAPAAQLFAESQRTIAQKLERLIALGKAPKPKAKPKDQAPPPPPAPKDQPPNADKPPKPPEPDRFPNKEQLQLLRELQAQLQTQLARFLERHPKLDPADELANLEWRSIQQAQAELADLFQQLNRPAADQPLTAPEKKKP